MRKEIKKAPTIRFRGFTDDWKQRKVGEFYDFKNGLNKNKEFFGTGVPIVNFTDVFHNRGLTASQLEGRVTLEPNEIKNYSVEKGDIFFTRTSETIEEIGYLSVMLDTPENTVFSGFVLRGRCFSGNDPFDNLFKQYVFFTQSFRDEMKKKSSMTTRALTSGTSIKEMLFQFPSSKNEQHQIGKFITKFDDLITIHQRKLDQLKKLKKYFLQNMFPAKGEKVPRIRFKGFTGDWEQRKFSELFKRRMERNNGQFDKTKWISVANMYYQDPDKVTSNNIDTRTYVLRLGDISFEGHSNKEFKIGRFVENDIGDGVISELFPIYQHITSYDLNFWKHYINIENIMFPKLQRCIEVSYTSSNKLSEKFFLKESILVPAILEQKKIGTYLKKIDNLITLHQRKLNQLLTMKKFMLQNLFI